MVVSKAEEHLFPAYLAGPPVLPNTRLTRGGGSAPEALLWREVLGNPPAVAALRRLAPVVAGDPNPWHMTQQRSGRGASEQGDLLLCLPA